LILLTNLFSNINNKCRLCLYKKTTRNYRIASLQRCHSYFKANQ